VSFSGWCLYRRDAARLRAESVYQAALQRRFAREAAALKAQWWADVDASMRKTLAYWEAQM
jgi:hypothetical protein